MLTELEVTERMLDWFADQKHWTRHTVGFRDDRGQVTATCLMGGVNMALFGNLKPTEYGITEARARNAIEGLLCEVASEQFPDRMSGGFISVPRFNDHPETTIEDVRLVLEKTRARLQEAADAG